MTIRLCVALALLAPACADDPNGQPQPPPDPFYDDFPNTWRSLVTTRPELGLPVTEAATLDDVILVGECTWDERILVGGAALVTFAWTDVAPFERIDLAIGPDGFERGFFTTAYPIVLGDRLLLPSNSAFFQDEERMLQIGGGMFPRVQTAVATELEGDTIRNTLALREVAGGRAFDARISRLENGRWIAQRFVFTTPVCTTSS